MESKNKQNLCELRTSKSGIVSINDSYEYLENSVHPQLRIEKSQSMRKVRSYQYLSTSPFTMPTEPQKKIKSK